MTVEAQLRSLAEAAAAGQRPVTAEEAMARGADRSVVDDRPDRRSWALVAASIAVLVGGLLVALIWDRTAGDERLPVVSIPESVAPETTVPPTIPPDGAAAEALVNEPTLDYRDGVEWWAPGALPDGWRYGYAVDDGVVQTVRLFADAGSTIDIEFGAPPSSVDDLAAGTTFEELGGEAWQVIDDGLARELDGRLLAVLGPVDAARVVAAGLELVQETDLVRPPFRADADPGPVVLTLPAEEVGGDEPFELRAHTDGLFTTVGGDIGRVSADDPVAFGEYVYDLSGDAESYRVVLAGVALAGLEQIQFGTLDGDAVEVTPTASDRFAEDFYALVIDVPADVLEQYEQGVLARLTRWTLTHVDGEQRVYDEPGAANCVNCDDVVGSGEPGLPPGPSDAPSLEFEPTNVYGDEMWWVPAVVPDGYEFAHATRWWFEGDHSVVYRSKDPLGHELSVSQSSVADSAGLPPPTGEEQIGGVTWSVLVDGDRVELSRILDGRVVAVSGDRQAAVAAAGTLELVAESRLERPPFRYDEDMSTSVVVAGLPGDLEWPPPLPTELRASTDGVAVSLQGGAAEAVPSDQPLRVLGGGSTCVPDSDVCHHVLYGIALPDVATVEIEQLDGEVLTVIPGDLSGRFGIGFFFVGLEVPVFAVDFPSVVPSITARDADGVVLGAISEPM